MPQWGLLKFSSVTGAVCLGGGMGEWDEVRADGRSGPVCPPAHDEASEHDQGYSQEHDKQAVEGHGFSVRPDWMATRLLPVKRA